MKFKTKEELAVIGVLIFALSMSITIFYSDIELGSLGDDFPELEIPSNLTDFQQFGILVTVAYDMLPTVAQQFSIGTISTQLLQTGFSPYLLMIIASFALLGGQMLIYLLGVVFKKIHHGVSKRGLGGSIMGNKFFHKYHFLLYMIVPFTGIFGDAIMLYSGFARINPIRIIPFLLISNFASSARWIFPALAQLEIGKFFGA